MLEGQNTCLGILPVAPRSGGGGMADALVSGASVRKDVEVQLLSAAPSLISADYPRVPARAFLIATTPYDQVLTLYRTLLVFATIGMAILAVGLVEFVYFEPPGQTTGLTAH